MERNQRSYQKRISAKDLFTVLQLSTDDFWVRTMEGKQQHYNPKQNRCLTLSGVLLRIPSLTKVEVRNFATFSQMVLLGSLTACYVSATCENVGLMQMTMLMSLRY